MLHEGHGQKENGENGDCEELHELVSGRTRDPSALKTYQEEGPRDGVAVVVELVDEKYHDTGHDRGCEKLRAAQKVERDTRVMRGLHLAARHFDCGFNERTTW